MIDFAQALRTTSLLRESPWRCSYDWSTTVCTVLLKRSKWHSHGHMGSMHDTSPSGRAKWQIHTKPWRLPRPTALLTSPFCRNHAILASLVCPDSLPSICTLFALYILPQCCHPAQLQTHKVSYPSGPDRGALLVSISYRHGLWLKRNKDPKLHVVKERRFWL